jgi:Mn2+/Fe2+ NRAMP family transporter
MTEHLNSPTATKRSLATKFGPGLLVTAAFVGPGTITTASHAGANFGFALLWALAFSVVATGVLQEMAARLGLVTRMSLATAMRASFNNATAGRLAIALVIAAIGLGNAAYEAGNIAGAALALATVTPWSISLWSAVIATAAGLLLASGRYKVLESVLVVLVLVMSALFISTAIMVAPNAADILRGLAIPSLPSGSALVVIALIGTTVVPYNLFLHASAVAEKWPETVPLQTAIKEARTDTGLSIGLGGLITLAILSTAAAAFFNTGLQLDGGSMAQQLEPLLGESAKYFFAAGLFASGLTSAITAPVAAAYAVCGALNWPTDLRGKAARRIALAVLVCGALFAVLGTRPLSAILFAQVANGLLLPVIAIFLLMVMNQRHLLGEHVNGWRANVLGTFVVVTAVGLGVFKLFSLAGIFDA